MTNHTFYELLPWDSQLFGYPVAKIHGPPNLAKLKEKNVRLAYWSIPTENQTTNELASQLQGFLADEKVTYLIDLPSSGEPPSPQIHSYLHHQNTAQLTSLALQSGIFSRFHVDPHFTNHEFEKLYTIWLEESLSGEIARDVLVYSEKDVEIGLLTLGEKNGRADIGLFSVDENSRGKSIGTQLINAAFDKARQAGYKQVKVVTQKQNHAACYFYEKIGFRVEKVENIYHLWL